MTAVERAPRRLELPKEVAILVDELRENKATHDLLLERRATLCRELRADGASVANIQHVIGLGRRRVHQILRGTRT
ncbi:hypothetical protein [Brevibacterium casei]|uniref:hypothetical protein n=1 Tax=Brevibacterium casei TaxID=33889 RepID=UPI0011AA8B09|nr:hypothetical protein [Brevibacterium casei]